MSRSYIPLTLDYSEYDFRNSQALESLEDALWESNHSAFSQEDYVSTKKSFGSYEYFNKPKTLYNLGNRILDKKLYYSPNYLFGVSGLKFITDNGP
jgi:hypothetical protein